MKVFVWTGYDNAVVYAADTYEQCMRIYDQVDDTIYELDMGLADASRAGLLREVSNARPEHRATIVRDEINMIVEKFSGSKHHVFERCTGFQEVENV